MRLLIDMNLSPAWAGLLESQDIVAIHWADVGAPQASDREIVEFARANDMVILTSDLDFSAILAATSGEKPSVVQLRAQNLHISEIGSRVIAAIRSAERELADGAILTVDIFNARLRLLPLRR